MTKKHLLIKIISLIIKKIFYYKYSITSIAFLIWIFIFDNNSILYHYNLYKNIQELEIQKLKLNKNIKYKLYIYNILKNNKYAKARYARKHFFMKKSSDNIIIITYKEDSLIK